jgi:hypothetical protein
MSACVSSFHTYLCSATTAPHQPCCARFAALQRAEAAPALSDREALTREAVTLMMRVPLAVDLGQVVPQLAYLRAFEAVMVGLHKPTATVGLLARLGRNAMFGGKQEAKSP